MEIESTQTKLSPPHIETEEDTAEHKDHNLQDFRILAMLNTLEKHLLGTEGGKNWRKPTRCQYLHTILFHWNENQGKAYLNVHEQHQLRKMPIRFKVEDKDNQNATLPGIYTALTTAYIQEPSLVKDWIIMKILEKKGFTNEKCTLPRNTIYAQEALIINYPLDIIRAIKQNTIITEQNGLEQKATNQTMQYMTNSLLRPKTLRAKTGQLKGQLECHPDTL